MKVICINPLPVEQVVSGHHAQEACWIGDRVKLVVELLELLVQQISRLALRLAAGASSVREGRDRDGETMSYWHEKTTEKKRKKTGDTLVRQTRAYIVTRRINQPHMQLICRKTHTHTHSSTHTHLASFLRLGPTP